MRNLAFAAVLTLLSGCASTGVVPVGSDTFMVSKQTATGYQSAVGIRAEILREANEYSERLGKKMIVISLTSKDGVPGSSYGTAELVFKAVRADDPEYLKSTLKRGPDQIIEYRNR